MSSSTFLSGEVDPNIESKRCTRIVSMLGDLSLKNGNLGFQNEPNDSETVSSKKSAKIHIIEANDSSESSHKISILSNENNCKDEPICKDMFSRKVSEDDANYHEEPPPLFYEPSVESEGPSLMDQMIADATIAKKEVEKTKNLLERKRAKSSSFGAMKKGFLKPASSLRKSGRGGKESTSSVRKIAPDSTVSSTGTDGSKNTNMPLCKNINKIYELDAGGEIVPSREEKNHMKTVRQSDKDKVNDNPLVLNEVQEAMKNNNPSDLLSTKTEQWATPDLMQRISQNPRLMAGMSNPKFTAALEAMQRDPKGAMEKFRDHPDVMEFLKEFCGVMGEHFMKLDRSKKHDEVKQNITEKIKNKNSRPIGPMEKDALKREEQRKAEGGASWDQSMTYEERKKLDEIMSNKEITEALMDPKFQEIMKKCVLPGKLRIYMQHPEYGPKLQMMINAGILQIA